MTQWRTDSLASKSSSGDTLGSVRHRTPETVKLWLDDIRTPPDESWTWVRTVADAILLMKAGGVCEASLDHDLGVGDDGHELPQGRTLVYWMAENDTWPTEALSVHSANVIGVQYIVGMTERYSPLVRVGATTRFVKPDEPQLG